MKKLIKLSLIMLIALTSCSKDETPNDSKSSNFMVGEWKYEAYIDENDYAWADEESGFYVFTDERLNIRLERYDESEYTYQYLPDSKELLFNGFVHDVEIINDNRIIIRNGCCGPELSRTE